MWTNSFTEDGSSLANWTQVSGTWSVVSGAFQVDTTGGTIARLKYNTRQDDFMGADFCLTAEMMMASAGVGSNAPMGFLPYWPGVTSGSPTLQLFKAGAGAGTKQARGEFDATTAVLAAFTPDPTWAFDVYQTVQLIGRGVSISLVLNGKYIASMNVGLGGAAGVARTSIPNVDVSTGHFIGLICNNAVVNFRNISLDYIALP